MAAEAQAVCDEMARRARHNVELLVARLTDQGYGFHSPDGRSAELPYSPPGEAAEERVQWLLATFEAVPMTLLSWLRIVGDVWLVGTHPEWPESISGDGLVIDLEGARAGDSERLAGYFEDDDEQWQEWADEDPDAGPFCLPLAPDGFHKANVSGSDPYGVRLPDAGVDAWWIGEKDEPFVSYLNSLFARGGFPYDTGHPAQRRITAGLAERMLEL